MQIDLFNKIVKPVLLYGCEIWGFGNIDCIERVQLKFLKYILGLKSSTPNCMVYGETGVKPLSIEIKCRIISYWSDLVIPQQNKLPCLIYRILLNNFNNSQTVSRLRFQWIKFVQNILYECGLYNIWHNHEFHNHKWLTMSVKQKLSDLFLNEWYSDIEKSSKCINYRLFKHNFCFETYLVKTPSKFLQYMIKFRTRNNKLPVETGSWNNIELNRRVCTLCDRSIGDEFHYIFECPCFDNSRKRFLKHNYLQKHNIHSIDLLMNTDVNIPDYKKLCLFIKEIILRFK